MAALLLSFAGASLGGALLGPLGVVGGRLAGAIAGSVIDRTLFSGKRQVEGPRLTDLDVMASTEGAPVPRVYGRARIAGELIWATRLEEVVATRDESAGGKGGGPRVSTTTYSYFANFAIGLCAGPVARVGRVWADGKLLDKHAFEFRFYSGSGDQLPDPLIEAKEGAGLAPAYRGLAYLVFERMPLENFGNRIPQLSVEVIRPVGRLERMIRAITLIPGATEFGYEPGTVVQDLGAGSYAPENRHGTAAESDWAASLDELQAVCPNLEHVALVVAWFGSDLRAGECVIRPGVDDGAKNTQGAVWSVAGLARGDAYEVSRHQDRAAFGGSPSDASVVHAIQNLKARGLQVTLYPFVMMDIPAGNALPDPWTGEDSQPSYPWRGRITCDPAPGQPGSVDGTSTAATQVAALFGTAAPADFSIIGESVVYSGPDEWTLRRLALHYAHLALAAGGADAFLIGSEYEALTRVRSASGVYPAVNELVALAADVKQVLGAACQVSYAANWTERGAHVLDAGGEIRFPLDPLWASSAIDFVGVDYYTPLSDWRDGNTHLDATLAATSHDPAYLRANLRAGEAFDFYYADDDARRAQARTPITDGGGKPWIHRAKDLWNWWSQLHFERVGGVELAAPTAWLPESKPIRLTEVGCPAVDKGANQPNVFPDAKSSAGGYPYFSNRRRDDLIQRRYHEAVLSAFDPAWGASESDNPVSSVYGGRMLDPAGIFPWTWDARPYPAFPFALEVWADGPNWETGHWLSGRLGSAPLDDLVGAVLADYAIANADAAGLRAVADGYVLDRPLSARAALEPLALAFSFDAVEDATIRFRPRGGGAVAALAGEELVVEESKADCRITRAQETELPLEITLGYTEIAGDFRRSTVLSRRLVGASRRQARADLALVTNDAVAERAADIWLQDLWAGRERAEFSLPPSRLALAPGDVVALDYRGRTRLLEISEVVDAESRAVRARTIDPEVFALAARTPRTGTTAVPPAAGPPEVTVLDLPVLDIEGEAGLQHFAARVSPWPRALAVWRSNGASFERIALGTLPAITGTTLDDLASGPTGCWDRANSFRVRLSGGALSSQPDLAVLAGANAAALRRAGGAWEVFQFASAELIGDNTYLLSRLLRGQLGSEWAMSAPLPAGARFVLLDRALVPVAKSLDLVGRSFDYRVGPADVDVGDPRMTGLSATVTPTALLPWSPAHLRGERTVEGVRIRWIRRTRINGDGWEALEVPLNEAAEAYRLEILDGGDVARTIETSAPEALYAAAAELADFGAPQTSLSVRVAQLSAIAGPGRARAATLQL